MPDREVFADPVVIPGPNVRSLFTDTEAVDEETHVLVDDGEDRFCPTCHRVCAATTLVCPVDRTPVVDLPAVSD